MMFKHLGSATIVFLLTPMTAITVTSSAIAANVTSLLCDMTIELALA